MHRNATRSVLQELSTLAQQLAHTLLLREGCGRVFPRVSNPDAATAPAVRRFAVQYWRPVHRLALFHTDELILPLKSKTFLALFRNSVIR